MDFASLPAPLIALAAAATLVVLWAGWARWSAHRAAVLQREREGALIQALDDAGRTGQLTLPHLHRLALHHMVANDRLSQVVGSLFRHVIGHANRYGPNVESDLLQILVGLEAEFQMPALPKPLALAVHSARLALPHRPDIVLALTNAGRDLEHLNNEQSAAARRSIRFWQLLAFAVTVLFAGVSFWSLGLRSAGTAPGDCNVAEDKPPGATAVPLPKLATATAD